MTDPTAACAEVVRASRSNFALAFRFLPRRQRVGMNAVYAFCRRTDDIADGAGTPEEKRAALDAWRADLDAERRDPVIRAATDAVAAFGGDPRHLHAVIDGCAMDLTPSCFETFDDLRLYCARVAGAVGHLCLAVWGVRGDAAARFAEELGLAVQLTNILRDVGADADAGRLYLPRDLLREHGVEAGDVLARRMTDNLRDALADLAARARAAYERADPRVFPRAVRRRLWPARIMAKTYRLLLRKIERRGFPVFEERVRLPKPRRLVIALGGLLSRWLP